jgi:hypothetical protein
MPEYRERHFPRLTPELYQVTSPPTRQYNCFAWAAERFDTWIPLPGGLDSLIRPYAALGLEREEEGAADATSTHIAIFGDEFGPTHAARRLANGKWTSKLGNWEDIEHDCLECLEGGSYGFVVARLSRRRPQ